MRCLFVLAMMGPSVAFACSQELRATFVGAEASDDCLSYSPEDHRMFNGCFVGTLTGPWGTTDVNLQEQTADDPSDPLTGWVNEVMLPDTSLELFSIELSAGEYRLAPLTGVGEPVVLELDIEVEAVDVNCGDNTGVTVGRGKASTGEGCNSVPGSPWFALPLLVLSPRRRRSDRHRTTTDCATR